MVNRATSYVFWVAFFVSKLDYLNWHKTYIFLLV